MSQSIVSKFPKPSFLYSLFCVVLIFGLAEGLMMQFIDWLLRLGIVLTPILATVIDVVGLTFISIVPVWWLIMRPWSIKFKLQHDTNNTQLNENQQLLQALNNHALVSIADLSGNITYANDLFCEISGYSISELFGQNHNIVNSGHHHKEFMHEMWHTISNGKVWQGDICNRTKLGSLYWVATTITPILDENGKPQQYISIRRDITHRVNNEQLQQQLQQDRATRLLISDILQQILPFAERGKQVLTELFNLKDFALQAKGLIYIRDLNLNTLIPLTVASDVNDPTNSHLNGQCQAVALNQELKVINHCDCASHTEAHGHYLVPIVSAANSLGVLALVTQTNPAHHTTRLILLNQIADCLALALLKDIAQQSTTAALENAEQASKAKSQFLANMSHEIRTPMNGVLGMLDVLHQTSLQGYQVEILDVIRDSAFSLLDIIEDVLDFSKIEAGKLELEQVPVIMREVIEKSAAMLNRLAINNGVELSLFTDPALPELVQGDASRLRQIVVNLTNNGIKFSSQQAALGLVSIQALLIERTAQQAIIELRVIDNGIGMDEATLAKLFTPFSQADASTTRRYGGTGLGLNITYDLVQLMSGSINVQSTPDQGSTFNVRLPFTVLDSPLNTELSPIQGLACLLIGDLKNQAQHFSCYLKSVGVIVNLVPDLTAAYQQPIPTQKGPWIWLLADDDGLLPDELQGMTQHPANVDIRLVVLSQGLRQQLRQPKDSRLVQIDNTIVTQHRIIQAVAMAAGSMKADSSTLSHSLKRSAFDPPAREVALEQGRLILVAEDNSTNQKVIQRQLAILGYAADIAADGQEALALWRSGHYPLLLTDLHMPTMDGYELAATIRAEEDPSKPLIIIAWTASVLKSNGENCLSVGMNDIIRKPSSQTDIQAMLEKWLPLNHETLLLDAVNVTDNSPDLTDSLAVLNIKVLEELVGDNPEIIKDFLKEFYSSLTTLAEAINAEYSAGHIRKMGLQAHTLKSSSRSVGALRLGDLCHEIEAISKTSVTIDDLSECLQLFNLEISAVNIALEKALNEL